MFRDGNGVVGTATPKILQERAVRGGSPWLHVFIREWQGWKKPPLAGTVTDRFRTEVHFEGESLWILNQWPGGARLNCCAAYCPGGAELAESRVEDGRVELALMTVIGMQRVKIDLPGKKPLLHWQTSITPRKRLTMPYWPCDLYPVDDRGNPLETRGVVHTKQKGPRGGILYVTLTRPAGGSFLYFQNLTSLNDYFEATHTTAADRISDHWPELGIRLPTSEENGLAEDKPVVISDAYILFSPQTPRNELQSTRLFLELYSELYLDIPRPASVHRDWPRRVDDTIHDLAHSPDCTIKRGRHRYLVAYVGDHETPPESMVQLAVLLPILEYARSHKLEIPLAAELQANIPTFYNPRIRAIGRWLPGDEHLLNGKEDHLRENVMDSWYLYHTCLNLARLAQFGNGAARKLFLDTLAYGIKVARHFNYRWPVLYDIYNFDIVRLERGPNRGGEGDVGAQYVHLMQQAHEMTGDHKYVEEAEHAACALTGLGFDLGYQYNNTAFGAGALMWLWKQTGNPLFRDLSHVCLAAILQNLWSWECQVGCAVHYQTFMGLPPLRSAPYLALYEELEMLAAFHEYFAVAGDDALPAVRVLLPEYCKYLIDRAWHHYPSEFPGELLADKPKTGLVDRKLSIPVEDMYASWEKVAQVGQQVYGAAAPFVFATRHCHEVPADQFVLHCDVPIRDFELRPGKASFQAQADPRCECHLRIIAQNFTPLPEVRVVRRDTKKQVKGELTRFGYLEFELPGNASVRVNWKRSNNHRRTKWKSRRTVRH